MEIKTKSGKTIKLEFAHYGEERPLNMTDGEKQIAEYLKSLFPAEIVRKSDDYLTALYKTYDVIRFKYTDRAKWLVFPSLEVGQKKHRFNNLDELSQFDEQIKAAYEDALYIDSL